MKAKVIFKDGNFFMTEIDDSQTPESLAQRMVASTGGFAIFEDELWGEHRIIPVNLSEVRAIVLTNKS